MGSSKGRALTAPALATERLATAAKLLGVVILNGVSAGETDHLGVPLDRGRHGAEGLGLALELLDHLGPEQIPVGDAKGL
jgi:hypothetical protein